MSGFAQFFVEGGVWMLPIAGVSVIALAVCVERIYALLFRYNTNAPLLYAKVSSAIKNDRMNEAIEECNKTPNAAVARILKNGIENASRGEEAVASAIEETTLEVSPGLLKRTGSLGGLASIATLLGLLGTIMGLIDAFRVVAEAPADQKSALLTKAIAVAMNTTAFGLIVAIPVTVIFLVLSGTTKKIMDDMDIYSVKLENALKSKK